jgi:fused signal recognition particle receptor
MMLAKWFKQLTGSSEGTSSATLLADATAVLSPKAKADLLTELEDTLILGDVGVDLSVRLVDALRDLPDLTTALAIREALSMACKRVLATMPPAFNAGLNVGLSGEQAPQPTPHVVLMVGVNGAGKTTAIGKLAYWATQAGKHVWIGAGDTFRAAAQEQLSVWSDRAGATVVTGKPGQRNDPAAVLFDTLKQAQAAQADWVLLDTAGRLHNQVNLMDELKKIKAAVTKALAPDATLEVWLVLDATTGQNALAQARAFNQAVGLTGLVLSKWDGSAKGGLVLSLADALALPVVWVGTGEQLQDLQPFDTQAYLDKLL